MGTILRKKKLKGCCEMLQGQTQKLKKGEKRREKKRRKPTVAKLKVI